MTGRLSKAAASALLEVKALKQRHAKTFNKGKKLISQAKSDRSDIVTSSKLKNRTVFRRNIVLIFDSPKDSVIDSQPTKARKQLT